MSEKPLDKKDELLELFKKLWLPVAGFLGAVTLAYNFYRLWVGDQKVVTYFLAGGGLVVLLVALVWVGFKKKTVEQALVTLDGSKRIITVPHFDLRYRRMAWVGLGVIGLFAVIGGGLLVRHRQVQKQLQIEEEQKMIVVIASFEGPEEAYGLRNQVVEDLNAVFASDSKVEIIAISEVVSPDKGSSYANELGDQFQADLVIWGWYRSTQISNVTIHIENRSPELIFYLNKSYTIQYAVSLAELESFSFQQNLGTENSLLISLLAGLIQYHRKTYLVAIEYFDSTIAIIEQDLAQRKDQLPPYYFMRAASKNALGQYDQAVMDYSKAIELKPDFALAYEQRGLAYFNLAQHDQAIEDLSNAIQMNPQSSVGYNGRGAVYAEIGQPKLALADLLQAVRLAPEDPLFNYNLGTVYFDLGQYEQAIGYLTTSLELNPNDAVAYSNRGLAYTYLGQIEQAINDYTKAIQVDPNYARAYYNRGATYLDELEEVDKALKDLNRAIELNPDYGLAYNVRGTAYFYLYQYEKAILDFNEAIRLGPLDATAFSNRGTAYAELGQYDLAIADLNQALDINPEDADAYYNRGKVYELQGQTIEAEIDFAKYEELTGQKAP